MKIAENSVAAGGIAVVALVSLFDASMSFEARCLLAGGFLCFFIVLFGFLYFFKSSIYRLPDPRFWLLVKSVSFAYLLFSLTLVSFTREEVMRGTSLLDSRLGVPLPEKNYAEACEIYLPLHPSGNPFFNVADRIDIFVIAHFFGWLVKAWVLRNWSILWITSLAFEFCEVSFNHLLPNFYECWWDHLLLDVFGCNLLGMWCGLKLVDYLKLKRYEFFNGDYRHTLVGVALIFLVTLIDLNLFFIKHLVHIPTSHWLMGLRTLIFTLMAAAGCAEMVDWANRGKSDCMQVVFGCGILSLELVAIFKWSAGHFKESMPVWIQIIWTVLAVCTFGYLASLYFQIAKSKRM